MLLDAKIEAQGGSLTYPKAYERQKVEFGFKTNYYDFGTLVLSNLSILLPGLKILKTSSLG